MNFLKFAYQAIVWKDMLQLKQPSSKTQETSSSDCLAWDLVPSAEMKLDPPILKDL